MSRTNIYGTQAVILCIFLMKPTQIRVDNWKKGKKNDFGTFHLIMRQSLGIVKGMVYFPKSGYKKPFAQALGHPEFNDFLFRRAGGCLRHSAPGCSLQRVWVTQGSTPFKTNSIASLTKVIWQLLSTSMKSNGRRLHQSRFLQMSLTSSRLWKLSWWKKLIICIFLIITLPQRPFSENL